MDSLLLALQRATHVTLDALSSRLAHLALTAGELNALANLSSGEYTVTELSRAIGSPLTTTTSLLDRLAKRGLITRRTPESNRRSVLVALTTEGEHVAAEVRGAISAVEAGLGLPPARVRELRNALAEIAEARP